MDKKNQNSATEKKEQKQSCPLCSVSEDTLSKLKKAGEKSKKK